MSAAVPKGYKQTKVGIIPEDWEVVKLGEIGDIITGSTPPTNDKNNYGSEYLFVSPVDIKQNKYIVDTEKKVSQKGFKQSRKVNKGSVLFVCIGSTIGKIAIANQDLITNQQINALYSIKYSNELLYYILFFKSNNIKLLAAEQAVPILNKSDFSKILISLPPLKEQEKIAEILTTWDEAISKQEELIASKEEQKKALMQKLLSGEVRFGGFSDEWEEVRLGEIGNPFNGLSGKTAEDFGTGEAKYITYKNIFDYSKIKLDIFENVEIASDEKQNLVQFGDIFFTVSSETPEEVGMSSVLLDNVSNTYLNSFCFGYRLNNFDILDPYFARFYFRSFQMRDKISRLAQGSTRFNLSKNEIMKLRVKLPSKKEQQKIAEVLSLSDHEINLLKNELEELKLQKKGLMQKLLTGEVRVRV